MWLGAVIIASGTVGCSGPEPEIENLTLESSEVQRGETVKTSLSTLIRY